MNLKKLLDEILYETKSPPTSGGLKVFYSVDIFIQNFPEPEPEETETPPTDDTVPPDQGRQEGDTVPESTEEDNLEVLNEEIFKFKSGGELEVPENKIERIQTLLDLLDYIKDKKVKGKPIINSMVIEIVSALAGIGTKAIDDLINKGDRLLITVDYGFSKQNSVGLRVNKVAGSSAISLSLKMDNKILAVPFNVNEFNRQVIYYRNAMLNK